MPRQKLNETLAALHEQLQDGAPLDIADRTHLIEVLDEIRLALDAGGAPAEPSLGDRINASVARFEIEHPTIATALHEVAALLRQL